MKTLLRSTFIADSTDSAEAHLDNFRLLDQSSLGFEQPEDVAIWTFVQTFVQQHRHVPDITTVRTHFERSSEMTVVDRLEALGTQRPRARGDFLRHLEDRAEDRRKILVGQLLQEAGEIISKGIEVKDEHSREKRILRGPIQAVRFLMEKFHDVTAPTVGSKLSGNATTDSEEFLAEYDRVKNDPLAGVGQYTGIKQIDEALQGAKRGEMWLHAAFTGGLKSPLMLNWAYNQAVHFNHDCLVFSLEMPYDQCRRILFGFHSHHPKFAGIHPPLDYQRIRYGQLTPKEEWFLREHVAPDFGGGTYGKIHIEVADPEKSDFGVMDIRNRAETIYSKNPFSLLFVDHALLVSSRKWVASTTERANEVIRDCKKMAMGFNKGQGMAVVLLFQISREGYKAALKARESGSPFVYNLTQLSYANEAERSSDIVTASWIDEQLSKENRVLLQCLKSRDQKPFEPFLAEIHWPTRRIATLVDGHIEDLRSSGKSFGNSKGGPPKAVTPIELEGMNLG